MPRDPEPTRQRLLDAALELWAENGVNGTSLRGLRITAGQANVGALHYHFGNEAGLLSALLQRELPAIVARRETLLDEVVDLRSAVAVLILPFAEMATGTTHERLVVRFLSRLFDDPQLTPTELAEFIGDTRSDTAFDMIRSYLPEMPLPLLYERVVVSLSSYFHAAAVRAGDQLPSALSAEEFREDLVTMFVGALSARKD